jgi:UDP-N-acetylmuramoylalanine--D-glutamate ligase
MNPARVGVLGLARSGRAAARLALAQGSAVHASDAGDTAELRAAAAAIRAAGGSAETGGHDVHALAACGIIVLSPGIPPSAAILRDPALRHVPRVSELEFAYRALRAPVIGVTGTNGKSTVTALIAHLLDASGIAAEAAGNIGVALSEIALRETHPKWVVVEASSYQLADVDAFAPRIGVLTNLAPDHLDRYASVADYYADKAHLFDRADDTSVWVLNGEDPEVLRLAGAAAGTRLFFRIDSPAGAGEQGAWIAADGELRVRLGGVEASLGPASALRLLGRHNLANALAAALAALAAGASLEAVRAALPTFAGLEHRMEVIGEHEGVLWINDSKATNVGSTLVALRSMERPFVLLLGGRPKGEEFDALLPALAGRGRAIVAYGEAAGAIADELGRRVHVERVEGGFDAVVERAASLARTGDAVLLSPACASFDMFRDYEDRGRQFKARVAQITGLGGVRNG